MFHQRGVNAMWNRLYRNHVIMPFPSYDTATNGWVPQADISWCAGPSRESEFVKFPNRLTTEADAVACALRSSEAWIDEHLGRSHSASGSEHAALIDMIGGLKKSLPKVSPTQPPRTQGSIQWHAEKTFTFGQFKSVIAKRGVKLSEQTLQRSYAALARLRKSNHCSWAQLREKVEHSQRDRSAAKSPARQQRARPIPLTARDWRRIV
jgi:hypothetical protein